VVADPWLASSTGTTTLDWDATIAYRRHLWSLGLGVAEAMDTAQRGMGLDWPSARQLIALACAEARLAGGAIACGANTDQLTPDGVHSLAAIEAAYSEQCDHIEECGGTVILMASRALAKVALGADDYAAVYGAVLERLGSRAILHWLGDMFDPSLTGYWGSTNLDAAIESLVTIVEKHADKIDGLKVSLLDKEREITLRRRLPTGIRIYSGDDFDYPELIRGDDAGHSHALLGIFDAIAPAASAALSALDQGDLGTYDAILAPTVPLSRHIFERPTAAYKVGIVLIAYLNGHQDHFRMVGGLESARSLLHLVDAFRLADQAGVLTDPELATARLRRLLALCGVTSP
jgi:hypothetical protein